MRCGTRTRAWCTRTHAGLALARGCVAASLRGAPEGARVGGSPQAIAVTTHCASTTLSTQHPVRVRVCAGVALCRRARQAILLLLFSIFVIVVNTTQPNPIQSITLAPIWLS